MISTLRERLACYGSNTLTNLEVLALAVGEQEARALFTYFGDMASISKATPQELATVEGMGKAKAERLHASLLFHKRTEAFGKPTPVRIESSGDAYNVMKPYMVDLMHEEFWVILLSRSNAVMEVKQISRGGVAGTVADPKLIFNAAILAKASGIVLMHNHPSGNTKPSQADIQLTKKLKQGGEMLEISVLDHIIYTDCGYYSFNDEGLMII